MLVPHLLFALAPSFAPSAQQAPILQPHTYRSPSGSVELHVDPSEREGGGPATYRLSRDGVVQWERELPVSLWDGGVTEAGNFGGYAYSQGPRRKGILHLIVADSKGEFLLDEHIERRGSRYIHGSPVPSVRHLSVDSEEDRILMNLYPDETATPGVLWRTYTLSSGKRMPDWFGDAPEGAPNAWRARTQPSTVDGGSPPVVKLERIALVELRPEVVVPLQPIRDVRSFVVLEQGGIEFVRSGKTSTEFVTLSSTGEVLEERSLPHLKPVNGSVKWYAGTADEWFATVLDFGADSSYTIYRVDVRLGTQRAIRSFPCPKIDALVSTRDGGFVLLGSTGRGTSRVRLMAVNASDEVLWQLDEGKASYKHPDQLFATEDLTHTTSGMLAVLSTVRDSVQIYTADGTFVRFIDLNKVWGVEPQYPSTILPDERGGFCVVDAGKLWRMTVEGELLETWAPTSTLANPYSLRRTVFEPDGTHWSTSLDLFTSRKPDGSPGETFGKRPPDGAIVRPRRAYIDRGGFIHVRADKRRRTWHVFDASGTPRARLTVPEPLPASDESRAHPTLGPAGHWFVPLSHRGDEQGHYEFSQSGEALQQVELGSNSARFRGPGTSVWSRTGFGTRLELFENGVSRRLLERRPDRHWIRDVDDFALSANGSTLALLDGPRSMTAETGHNLCVYDGDGTARFTLPLPEPFRPYRIATSDRWAVVTSFEHDAMLVNLESKRIVQLELEASEHSWRWGFSPDGKELWAVDIPSLLLERYALPLEPSEPGRK